MHNIVWEEYYEKIPDGMQVHHIDHNPSNNKIKNLMLFKNNAEHKRAEKLLSTGINLVLL